MMISRGNADVLLDVRTKGSKPAVVQSSSFSALSDMSYEGALGDKGYSRLHFDVLVGREAPSDKTFYRFGFSLCKT